MDARNPVLLVALDGADWKVLRPLMDGGRVPHLSRLIREGASGDLHTLPPALSPVIWTTIATGVPSEEHGITDFWHEVPEDETPASAGGEAHEEQLRALGYIGGRKSGGPRMALFQSTDRRAPALWTLLSDRGLASHVVAWWVSYPAEAIRGVMVSERFFYNRFALVAKDRGLAYEEEALVSPPEQAPRLRPLVVPIEDVGPRQLGAFLKGPVDIREDLALHDPIDELRLAYAKDESVMRIALALSGEAKEARSPSADRSGGEGDAMRPDPPRGADSARAPESPEKSDPPLSRPAPALTAVYFQGIDIASHYYWKYRFPGRWRGRYPGEEVPAEEIGRFGQTIDRYYELIDQYVGRLVAATPPSTTVIVCSDHGFETGKRPPGTPGAAATISGVHEESAPPGIVIICGPGVPAGSRLTGASVYDIAPTVLSLLDVSAPSAWKGRPLAGPARDVPAAPQLPSKP